MRILVIGGGGREHALAWALSESAHQPELFIAPGNAGTARLGTNVPIPALDLEGLKGFVVEHAVDLTVVGPEQPLVHGLVDQFEAAGLPVVGPSAGAAQLEGSKDFAKNFMARHGIPTAQYRTFTANELEQALAYVKHVGAPLVLKADGLAAGKGVLICMTKDEAIQGLHRILQDQQFGSAGHKVVIEEFMEGEEASIFVVTDGSNYGLMAPAQDHKRIGEGDTGPNTGGMGAYAPAPVVTPEVMEHVRKSIIEPTLNGMAAEGTPYRGFLYCGLMMTSEGPKVVEYNCRLGDPETQVVLPLLKTDLVDLLTAVSNQTMNQIQVENHPGAAACVVLASAGYPGSYVKGKPIHGLETARQLDSVQVFHAGTETTSDGQTCTSGGRVLGVSALGHGLVGALEKAYRAVDEISFEGKQYRRDIGQKGLKHLG